MAKKNIPTPEEILGSQKRVPTPDEVLKKKEPTGINGSEPLAASEEPTSSAELPRYSEKEIETFQQADVNPRTIMGFNAEMRNKYADYRRQKVDKYKTTDEQRSEARESLSFIDDAIEETRQSLKANTNTEETPWWARIPLGGSAIGMPSQPYDTSKEAQLERNLTTKLRLLNDTKTYLNAVAKGDKQSAAKRFWEGAKTLDVANTVSFGISSLLEGAEVGLISRKLQDEGEDSLTQEEKDILVLENIRKEAESVASQDRAFSVGVGIAETVPFIADMMLTDGIGTAIRKGTFKGSAALIKNKAARKLVANLSDSTVRSLLFPSTYERTIERMTPEIGFNEEGEPVVTKEGEDLASALTKSVGENSVEIFSEGYVGSGLSRGISWVSSKGTKILQGTKVGDVISAVDKAAKTSPILKMAAIQDPISEFGEEVFAGIVQPIVTGEGSPMDFFEYENMIRTALTVGIMSSAMTSAATLPETTSSMIKLNRIREGRTMYDSMTDENKQLFNEAVLAETIDGESDKMQAIHLNMIDENSSRQEIADSGKMVSKLSSYLGAIKNAQREASKLNQPTYQYGDKVHTSKEKFFKQVNSDIDKGITSPFIEIRNDDTAKQELDNLVSGVEVEIKAKEEPTEEVPTPTAGEMKPVDEMQRQMDYLTEKGIEVPDGATAEDVQAQYNETRTAEREKASAEFDTDIAAAQERLGLPTAPTMNVSQQTEDVLDKLDNNEPVVNEDIQSASDELYARYKELETMKQSDTRQFTTEQIESMQEFIGEEITRLEDYATRQKETGEFVTETQVSPTAETGAGEVAQEVQIETKPTEATQPAVEPLSQQEGATIPQVEETVSGPTKISEKKAARTQRIEEIDAEIGEAWNDLADIFGAKQNLTGEQRKKLAPVVAQLVKSYAEKYALKGADLIDAVREHLLSRNIPIDNDVEQLITEQSNAKEITPTIGQAGEQAQRMESEAERQVRMGDSEQNRKSQEKERVTGSQIHKPKEVKNPTVRKGRFASRVSLADTKVPDHVKNAFNENKLGEYIVLSDENAKKIADEIVASSTLEEIKSAVFDSSIHPSIRGHLMLEANRIMEADFYAAQKSGDTELSQQKADEHIDFLDEFQKETRIAAQALRFLGTKAALDTFAPYTYVRKYERSMGKERDRLMNTEAHNRSSKNAQKAAKKLYDDSVNGALDSKEVQRHIDNAKKRPEPKVAHDRLKELKVKEKEIIEKWKKARKSSLSSTIIPGLTQADIELGGELAINYLEQAAYHVANATRKLAKTLKDLGIEASDSDVKKIVSTSIDDTKLAAQILGEKDNNVSATISRLSQIYRTLGSPKTSDEIMALLPKDIDGLKPKEKLRQEELNKASERLAMSIFGEVSDKKPKDDPLTKMVNTLLGKFKERDIKKEGKKPKSDIERIAAAIRDKDEYESVWQEARQKAIDFVNTNEKITQGQRESAISRIEDSYKKATEFTFSEAQVDRAIKRKAADLDIKIREVVKEFYDIRSAARGKLVDAIIEETGLEGEQAKILSRAIEERFNKLMSEGRQKLIDRYVGKIGEGKTAQEKIDKKKRKTAESELLELVNIGAFDSQEFREAYATAVGIPEFNQEHADIIKSLAENVRKQKHETMRHRETQVLIGYMRGIQGVTPMDILTSIWYANVLGNIKTQERNFIGGFSGVSTRVLSEAMLTGRVGTLMRGMFDGLKIGGTRFKDVWKEGYAPFSEKIEVPNTAELFRVDSKGILQLWNNVKYIGRLMNGMDLLNATAGKESFARLLAAEALNVSRWKSLVSSEYRRKVNEEVDKYLNIDKETIDRIKKDIDDEAIEMGYSELDKQLILFEAIDKLRPIEVTEQASRFGIYATGNVGAYGYLGFLSDILAQALRKLEIDIVINRKTGKTMTVKPFSLFAAFTKISGNVATMSLNYVPVIGLWRIHKGGYGTQFKLDDKNSKYHVELTPREKKTILAQQLLGLVASSLAIAMSDPGEDDDPFLRITANGTGNYSKNRSLEDWQEYSIGIKVGENKRVWIPYKYTPLVIPFGIIGFARDSKRFRDEYKDVSDAELLGRGLLSIGSFIGDMSSVGAMTDVMEGLLKGADEQGGIGQVVKNVERTISSFYTPGIYRDAVDILESLYGIGVEEPIKGTSEFNTNLLMQRFMGRSPISVIKRIKTDGSETTEYLDAYGRTTNRKMFWDEIAKIDETKNEIDKLILEHQKKMDVPSIPNIKTTRFNVELPNGDYGYIILDMANKQQNVIWHEYLKKRGSYIVDAIRENRHLQGEEYRQAMDNSIRQATSDAKYDIEVAIDDKKIKIKESQIK